MLRVALAPLNPIVGDLEGNRLRILEAMRQAASRQVDLLLLPELALLGYPPRDLLDRPAVIERAQAVLDDVVRETGDVTVIIGTVLPNLSSLGRRVHNAAVVARRGVEVARYHKQLLPSYDVFDETRYFEPGRSSLVCTVNDVAVGPSICEDIWNLEGNYNAVRYEQDPVSQQVAAGARVLANISASPFQEEKLAKKEQLLIQTARRYQRPVLYVNQLGGKDSLVFDGTSWVVDADGRILARSRPFSSDLLVHDLSSEAMDLGPHTGEPIEEIFQALQMGLRDYVDTCGFKRVLVGLSGGIDSALTAAVAAAALGPERVVGVSMPSRYSSQGSKDDAHALAQSLGIEYHVIPIERMHTAFLDELTPHFAGREPDVTEENVQARVRGVILMALSNKFGWLVLPTGNKSELAMGYCTLYGDMCGGMSVIGDLSKTTVYALSRHINREREVIPRSSIDKPPSAELRPDQKDTDSLPPYEVLDPILRMYVEEHASPDHIVAQGHDPKVVAWIVRSVNRSEYKRQQAAPAVKVSAKAFGFGRRLPIAARFPDEGKA